MQLIDVFFLFKKSLHSLEYPFYKLQSVPRISTTTPCGLSPISEIILFSAKQSSDTPRPISRRRLNASAEALTRTPRPYQPDLLSEVSSTPISSVAGGDLRGQNGKLFSGRVSSLDAFSSYPTARGGPAMPYQTTGRPEAPTLRSSRTERLLPSAFPHIQQRESDLSHDGLNPAHVPF